MKKHQALGSFHFTESITAKNQRLFCHVGG